MFCLRFLSFLFLPFCQSIFFRSFYFLSFIISITISCFVLLSFFLSLSHALSLPLVPSLTLSLFL